MQRREFLSIALLLSTLTNSSSTQAKASKHNIQNGHLIWSKALDNMLEFRFHQQKSLRVEIFNDWLPNDECCMSVDEGYKDIYGMPVGKLRLYSHSHNQKVAYNLADKLTKYPN
jgi:hypothetical protein